MSAVELGISVIEQKLDNGFYKFFQKLNIRFTPWQKRLKNLRNDRLAHAYRGVLPQFVNDPLVTTKHKVDLPDWLKDQRNQMTGPADNNELIVKLLNSKSPGVMLDLEDSMANDGHRILMAHDLIKSGLYGTLTYTGKDYKQVKVQKDPKTVVFVRPRGLHMDQIIPTPSKKAYRTSATVFDLAYHFYDLDLSRLAHPPCVYIPKSESAQEAVWWREIFTHIEKFKGWKHGTIKCMALVEAHPLAYEMPQFMYFLRPYIVGLNLGRWDYMASIGTYMMEDPKWVLPDRNKIPTDAPFFQKLRKLMVNVCHERGALAVGGMTALFPSRTDEELNNRAIETLKKDKRNEASIGMDGAWTGHPDQNEAAIRPFVEPNQINFIHEDPNIKYMGSSELREPPQGPVTEEGTREAISGALQYRNAVAAGKGAVLINGYMEDLATDRIYRVMLAQRLKHNHITVGRFNELFEEEGAKAKVPNLVANITYSLITSTKFNPE
jgi:malate synthase